MTIATSMVTLSTSVPTCLPAPAPSGPPSSSNTLSMPKPPAQRPPYKTWTICCPTQAPMSPAICSDWSSDEDWDGTKQKERQRIHTVIRIENGKAAEEESRKKAKERTLSCAPDLLGYKPIYPPPTLYPQPQKREKGHKRSKKIN